MTTKNLSTAILGLAFATIFVFRDAVAQVVCNTYLMSISDNSQVPCSGSSVCASVATIPGGIVPCTNKVDSPTYWVAFTPTVWHRCEPRTGAGECAEVATLCETVILYKTKADCEQNVCGTNDIQKCRVKGT